MSIDSKSLARYQLFILLFFVFVGAIIGGLIGLAVTVVIALFIPTGVWVFLFPIIGGGLLGSIIFFITGKEIVVPIQFLIDQYRIYRGKSTN